MGLEEAKEVSREDGKPSERKDGSNPTTTAIYSTD
jgi:hypothetical protein